MPEQLGLRGRQRDPDPVGQLESLLLAHRVDLVDQVEDERLELELGIERGVERDSDAVGACHGPPLLAGSLDQDLVWGELVLGDSEAAAVELVELAARERLAHVTQCRAELRAEQRQVRLHAELARLDVAELDLLHA